MPEAPQFPKFTRYLPGPGTPWGVMHVVDRVVGRQMLLGPQEKEFFRLLLRKLVRFTGLELVTWTCLDNHFHLLLRVPNADEGARLRAELAALGEEALLARMEWAFSREHIEETRRRLEQFRREGKPEMAESVLRRLREQTFDVSAFMHMLKRRFSAWYNKRHGREGHLWQGRYRSVLVEDEESVVLRMAAYIDLNAVRAGIAKRPEDYRWSGYAEAAAGHAGAREGIVSVVRGSSRDPGTGWEEAAAAYRDWLRETEPALDANEEAPPSAPVPAQELLRCRVRYFSAGVAIGSKAFVESIFTAYRHCFGPNRQTGARPMRGGAWDGLCALRDLRKDVIGESRNSS